MSEGEEMTGKYLVIVSKFTQEISQRLLEGTEKKFKELGIGEERIDIEWVPGCFEIPTVAAKAARSHAYAAIVCLGAVIRGETTHFDYVANYSANGLMLVGIETETPIINGILTTENMEQAIARSGGLKCDKGYECIEAAEIMIEVLKKLNRKGSFA